MNKKQMMVGLLTSALLLTGCGNNQSNDTVDMISANTGNSAVSSLIDNNTTNSTQKTVTSTELENMNYETIGEIIEFDQNTVHVITGDMVEIFTVPNEDFSQYYLGQTVIIQNEFEDEYSIMAYEQEDFSTRYTNMGDLITRVQATFIKQEKDQSIFLINGEEMSFSFAGDQSLEIDQIYTLDYISFNSPEIIIIDIFNEQTALALNIINLSRSIEGELMIHGKDQTGVEYIMPTYAAVKNFNLSDLVNGQNIKVYTTRIMESAPVEVICNRIDLLEEAPIGVTQMDYEIVGVVIEINQNNIHVLMGDLVDIYAVDSEQLQLIHLGETVKLFEKEGHIMIEPYLEKTFNTHTNMGDSITEFKGTLKSIITEEGEKILTILSDGIEQSVKYYGDQLLIIDHFYEFETISFTPDESLIIELYDPETIVEITVNELSRAENGELTFFGTDSEGGEYNIGTSYATKNFNLSELQMGDILNVYVDELMESWPMQVSTRKIIKK